jgi:hypothetical protein
VSAFGAGRAVAARDRFAGGLRGGAGN